VQHHARMTPEQQQQQLEIRARFHDQYRRTIQYPRG
jgi:hypothetical protein